MLISFSVANFLSFKEKQTLDFTPEALKEFKEHLHIPYLYDIDAKVLKSIALYGHNSHGKSNFLKAYSFFVDFIFNSFSFGRKEDTINVENFRLNTATHELPTEFEATFYLRETKFRYGFKVTTKRIVEEWLYYSEPKIRENNLFTRQEQEIRISKTWNKESDGQIERAIPFAKSKNLFLSVLISQDQVPKVDAIEKWFRNNVIVPDVYDKDHIKKAILILTQPRYRAIINKFIENADLGFVSIIEKIDSLTKNKLSLDKEFLNLAFSKELENYEIFTEHKVYDHDYKFVDSIMFELLKSESSGTLKYLIVSCYLAYAIKEGQLILFDEIDSSFHSLLLKVLVEIYNDGKINTSGSQMVFTTHNTILLDKVLRRDQIVFVEKNEFGESSIRRMHNPKNPIRIDTSIEKEYRKGKLGGVSKKIKENKEQPRLNFD